jgi:hypothetical protein
MTLRSSFVIGWSAAFAVVVPMSCPFLALEARFSSLPRATSLPVPGATHTS